MKRIGICAAVLAVAGVFVGSVGGITVDPQLWEQIVCSADYVGVVECTTAGSKVAEYRVVESWKGWKQEETVRIRMSSYYWKLESGVVLVGERYFIAGYKSRSSSPIFGGNVYGVVPLWWRKIEGDSYPPFFLGFRKLFPDDGWRGRFRCRGDEDLDLDEFREYVKKILSLDLAEREMLLFRLLTEKYFSSRYRSKELAGEMKEGRDRLLEEIARCDDPGAILEKLLDYAVLHSDVTLFDFESIVDQGVCTEASWEKLRKILGESSLKNKREQRRILTSILEWRAKEVEELLLVTRRYAEELREEMDSAKEGGNPEEVWIRSELTNLERTLRYVEGEVSGKVQRPTVEQLDEYRKQLKDDENMDYYLWTEAFGALSEYDPDAMCKWLVKWKNPGVGQREERRGYELGSRFAWRCGRDRKKYFMRLVKAKDDYVQVAGAVYLTFEDEEAGLKYLRKFRRLKGEPGLWAALNLARRGDMDAVDEVVRRFCVVPDDAGGNGSSKRSLIRKLIPFLSSKSAKLTAARRRDESMREMSEGILVVLSNSAKHSGVEQDELLEKTPGSVEAWWEKNRSKITIHDPWLEMLTEQKVD